MNLILRHNPAWLLRSVHPPDGRCILIGGDGHQVAVPAPLLLSVSPLVRSILSDLLPPAFCPCFLSLPAAAREVLQGVRDILTTGKVGAGYHVDDVEEVKQVLRILGVEASLVSYQIESIQVGQVCERDVKEEFSNEGPNNSLEEEKVKVEVIVKIEDMEDSKVAADAESTKMGQSFAPKSCTSENSVPKNTTISCTYSKKHQHEIVQFLVSHSAYKMVKGNSIWQRIEEGGLCKGTRAWQSMKEHFRKKIIPQIHSFGLSWRQVRRFRSAFGLDQEHKSDQDDEEDDEVPEMKRNDSEKRINQFKPRRTSSPLGSSLKCLSNDPSNDGSPSHLKNVSRSTIPFMGVSRSISPPKDVSRCISPLKNKSRSISPLKDVSRSISPQKDMSISTPPLKNNSSSATPLKDVSRSTSPLKDVSRSTSPFKHNSRSTSPMKYTKSVKVQLRKFVHHSPHSWCCRGINTETGRKVRQGVVAARDDEEEEDTNDDCTDADQIDSTASVTIGHEGSTSNTKAESAKKNAEREFWYASRYRQPYSRGEEEAVVNYLLWNGGYSVRGGNAVWQKMEEDWICPGRTCQSLRKRFYKNIDKNLKQFGVSKTQLEKVDRKMEVSSMEGRERKKARGFRQNANYYSRGEDLNILKFIVQNKRFEDVRGVEVWQVIEERKVVKGRSWQSMKERFRKVISARIKSYGLSAEIVKEFGGVGGKKKEKRMAKNS